MNSQRIEQAPTRPTPLRTASRLEAFNFRVLDQRITDERVQRNYLDYPGISLADVDLVAEAGLPPNRTFIAGGRFNAEAGRAALLECAGGFEPTDEYDHGGVAYSGWGTAWEQNIRERWSLPIYDALARGGRFYLTDTIAVRTPSDGLMESVIDAGTLNERRSLAGMEDFRLAANMLHQERTWFAYITRQTQIQEFWDEYLLLFLTPSDTAVADWLDEQWAPTADKPALRERQLFAAGVVANDEETYVVLEDEHDGDAKESAISGIPWREIITSADIEAEGRVVVARLHGLDSWTFSYQVDPLTLHE